MTDINFQLADLGRFADQFQNLIKKYEVEDKTEGILNLLGSAIVGKLSKVDLANLLVKDFDLDFPRACKLAFAFGTEILEQKDVSAVKVNLQKRIERKYSPDVIAAGLLSAMPNYKITDENLKNRFIEAIISWLKDIRDLSELKEVLMRSAKVGGIGMEEKDFLALYDLLVEKKAELEKNRAEVGKAIAQYESGRRPEVFATGVAGETNIDVAAKPVLEAPKKEKVTGEDITIGELIRTDNLEFEELAKKEAVKKELAEKEKSLAKVILDKEEFLEKREEIAPPAPSVAGSVVVEEKSAFADFDFGKAPVPEEKSKFADFDFGQARQPQAVPERPAILPPQPFQPPVQQPVPAAEAVSPLSQNVFVQPSAPRPTGRPQVADVLFSPHLYGPVEELAALSINDLRRLSKDPQEAVNKLMMKLDLLEDESLVKRAEGIRALKSSPLYQLYAEVMNKAILEGKSFSDIIAADKSLTLDEFKAIMELNKILKY